MLEVRLQFEAGSFAIMGNDRVVIADYANKHKLVNIANAALEYGKITDEMQDDKDNILSMRIEVPDDKEDRLLKEVRVLSKSRGKLGELGYVLGLHSSIFLSKDSRTGEFLKSPKGYSAVVEGHHLTTGTYMYATISNSVVEEFKNPYYFEDYIYLHQINKNPGNIPTTTFDELFNSLNDLIKSPAFFLTPKGKVMMVRRYAGIVLGLLVRHDLKGDIPTLMSIATSASLNDDIDGRIIQSFLDAFKLAKKWGDI